VEDCSLHHLQPQSDTLGPHQELQAQSDILGPCQPHQVEAGILPVVAHTHEVDIRSLVVVDIRSLVVADIRSLVVGILMMNGAAMDSLFHPRRILSFGRCAPDCIEFCIHW